MTLPDLDAHPLLGGLLLVATGALWAVLVVARLVGERAIGFAASGVLAFVGGELVVVHDRPTLGYLLLGLTAAAGLIAYVRTREISAVGVGAVALAVVVPQAIIDYAEGALGAAGALLVSGLSVVAVSVLVARLHGRRPDDAAPPGRLA